MVVRLPLSLVRAFSLSLSVFFLVLLVGCEALEGLTEEAENRREAARLTAELDAAQAAWEAAPVSNYQISVTSASVWHVQTVTLTVENGSVVAHTATSADCVVAPLESEACTFLPYNPNRFTVEGLFGTAREWLSNAEGDNRSLYQISGFSWEFDPIYHYPARLASSPPNILDADRSLFVNAFEALE